MVKNYATLQELLDAKEGENVEFKRAENHYDFERLVKYACAIANCGGGHIVLGVTDERPRQVVGSSAFEQPERIRKGLMERLGIGIDFQLYAEDGKRVLAFSIEPRPSGVPVQDRGRDKGTFWWRDGDSLVPMPAEEMRAILPKSVMISQPIFAQAQHSPILMKPPSSHFENGSCKKAADRTWQPIPWSSFLPITALFRQPGSHMHLLFCLANPIH